MKLSGENFRTVLAGTKGTFDLSVSIDQVTGEARFGLSGNGAVPIDFYFSGGRIYDPNDRYVYSYISGETVNISGNFSGEASPEKQNYNYSINDNLFCLSGVNNGGYDIEKFFVNTTGCNANINLDVASTASSYSITMPGIFREQTNFTGYVTNNNTTGDFRVLSGQVTSPAAGNVGNVGVGFIFTGHDLKATGDGGTGKIEIYPSGAGNIGSQFGNRYSVELDLYTNIGKIKTGFVITGRDTSEFNVFQDVDNTDLVDVFFTTGADEIVNGVFSSGEGNIGVRSGDVNSFYSVYRDRETYTGEVGSPAYLYQSLSYYGGYTGDLFTGENGAGIYSSGSGNLTGSGYLEGSGYIESGTTGDYDLSGVDQYDGTPNTSGLYITGKSVNKATGRFFWYATGNGSLDYSITATGYSELSGSGGLSGTAIQTTGTIAGTVTETGIGGSGEAYASVSGQEYGKRTFNKNVTNSPASKRSIDSMFYTSGLQGVGANSTSGGTLTHTGKFSGDVLASGTYQGITGSGNYSGYLSGYTKTFENTFNLKTGDFDASTRLDHKANSLTSGTPVQAYRSSGHTEDIPYNITSSIEFSPSFDDINLVAKFLTSGVGVGSGVSSEFLITGKQ